MAGAMIVNAAYGTTCADGEYTDEQTGQCETCVQFTTDESRLDLEQDDCPPIEYIEPVCTAIYFHDSVGRMLCGGAYITSIALAISTSLLY